MFKALADPSRRLLLDKLFKRDGQTLGALEEHLPAMTRFGVMKHLGVLEDAGLITTRKVGREKLHYLNPVPIRQVFDRWTSKYAKPFTRALVDLKKQLEGENYMNNDTQKAPPKHVYEVFIRTTPQKLWDAITKPEFTKQYFYGSLVKSDWKIGSPVVHADREGKPMIEGKVIEVDAPHRLVTTFASRYREGCQDTAQDRPSRVTWLIEQRGEACKLTLTHDDFDGETDTYKSVGSGWNPVLSGLKTLLETGKALVIAAPAAS
ncbi:MAG: SRPBCC domain-containing protein [Polyangiales bacterium]